MRCSDPLQIRERAQLTLFIKLVGTEVWLPSPNSPNDTSGCVTGSAAAERKRINRTMPDLSNLKTPEERREWLQMVQCQQMVRLTCLEVMGAPVPQLSEFRREVMELQNLVKTLQEVRDALPRHSQHRRNYTAPRQLPLLHTSTSNGADGSPRKPIHRSDVPPCAGSRQEASGGIPCVEPGPALAPRVTVEPIKLVCRLGAHRHPAHARL